MEVYVDKGKLESHDIQSITDLGGKEFQQVRMWFKDIDNVEILSLADHTKQVRKELLQEIDYGAIRKMAERPDNLCYKDALYEYFLDQIQDKGE